MTMDDPSTSSEFSPDDHRRRYEAAMAAGATEYQDIIDLLDKAGLPTHFTQTGGMNAALEVQLETGATLLITDQEDTLAWSRDEHSGWGVGLYNRLDDPDSACQRFAESADGSHEALLSLIRQVLTPDAAE